MSSSNAVMLSANLLLVASAVACRAPHAAPLDAPPESIPLRSASSTAFGEIDASPPSQEGGAHSNAVFVMDATFRSELAPGLVAQVERSDWAAFLPAEGTTYRQGARVSLAGGGLTHASWTRACTSSELEARHVDLLRQVARDLTRSDRKFPEDGFTCAKDTCTAQFGEMGFNGELVFARVGDAVRLVAVSDHGANVVEDVERAIDRANRALRPPPPCAARSPLRGP